MSSLTDYTPSCDLLGTQLRTLLYCLYSERAPNIRTYVMILSYRTCDPQLSGAH